MSGSLAGFLIFKSKTGWVNSVNTNIVAEPVELRGGLLIWWVVNRMVGERARHIRNEII